MTKVQVTTVKQVESLKYVVGGNNRHKFGGKGARDTYVTVRKNGDRAFHLRHRYTDDDGKLKTEYVELGEYPALPVSDVADAVAEKRAILKDHRTFREYEESLQRTREQEQAEQHADNERSSYTVRKLVREYIEDVSNPKSKKPIRTYRRVQLALESHIVSKLGDLPAHEVRRMDITDALDHLDRAGHQIQRNRVIAYYGRAFNWAEQNNKFDALERQGLIIANPCRNVVKAEESPKTRSLGGAEIRRFLTNLPESGIRDDIADVFRLILLTAARPGEVVRMRYSEIEDREVTWDRKKIPIKVWELPDTKNKRPLVQPLPEQALAIIDRRRKTATSDYLFPAATNPKKHLRADNLSAPLRTAIPKLKVLPFTAHDLRRTVATELSAITDEDGNKVTRFVKAKVLNHSDREVTRIYDRFDYLDEKHHWLALWAGHLDRLAGANVTAMKAKAGE